MNRNIISVFFLSILLLSLFMSCPDPITEDLVARVEDKGAPTIIVSTPSNNSIYRSLVTFSGRVTDDAKNSIERFSFNVQNRPIGGGVIISGSSVSQDTSAGETVVSYTPSNGNFSFSFSTIDPDVLTGRLFIDLEAVDWNGNAYAETIILYENEDGPYVDLTSPVEGSIYSGNMSLTGRVMDQYVAVGETISYENINEIQWRVVGTSILSESLSVFGQTPDAFGNINSGGSLTYNTETGSITGVIPLSSQTGVINFEFTVSDFNSHTVSESFNISDGNVSPAVVIDSFLPPEYKGTRYFKAGDIFSFEGHVGPTNRDYDNFNYYVDPGAPALVNISPIVTNVDELFRYDFSTPTTPVINTAGYSNILQKVKFQFQAEGSSETAVTTVFITPDFDEPEFVLSANPVTSDVSNYYIDVEFTEPVWGGEDFSSVLSKDDFSITNTSGSLAISNLSSVTGNLEDGETAVKLVISKSSGNIIEDGTTVYTITSGGTSGQTGIFDVANNLPSNTGTFKFPDKAAPYVIADSESPDDGSAISSHLYSGSISFKFNEPVEIAGDADGKIEINGTDTDVCTIAANGVDVSVTVPLTAFTNEAPILNTITIPAGSFTDENDNDNIAYIWTVIKDTTSPVCSGVAVKTGSTLIPAGSTRGSISEDVKVILTFSDSDFTGQADKYITLKKGATTLETVTADTAVKDTDAKTATITFQAADFTTSGSYEISIDSGAFEDTYENPCTSYTGLPFDFNVDVTPPECSNIIVKADGTTITDGSSIASISTNVELILTFSDDDFIGETDKYIILKRGGTNVTSIAASDAVKNAVAKTATVTFTAANFVTSGAYEISIDSGAFVDVYNNPCAVYTGLPFDFNVDSIAPTLDSHVPLNSAVSVSESSDIKMTFSENISKGTGSILIKNYSADVAAVTITQSDFSVSDKVLTIAATKLTGLSDDTKYYIDIVSGVVTDTLGNPYAGIGPLSSGGDKDDWVFTTGPAPTLSSHIPLNNAISVSEGDEITMTFSENISKGTGSILIKKYSDNSTTVTIAQSDFSVSDKVLTIAAAELTGLSDDTKYYMDIVSGVVTDAAENPYAGIGPLSSGGDKDDWVFTTGPVPTLSSHIPLNNAISVSEGDEITMTFSENISKGTGSILIKKYSDSSTTVTIAQSDFSVSDKVLTIAAAELTGLSDDTKYYMDIVSGVVTDAVGNPYAGIGQVVGGSKDDWTFTTGPAPALLTLLPATSSLINDTASDLVITLDENILKGTGNIVIKKYDGTGAQTIAVTNADVTISGAALTIDNSLFTIANGTAYYVEMASGVVKDTAGNPYAGIGPAGSGDKDDWTFSVDTTLPKVSSSLSPANGAKITTNAPSISFNFSEDVSSGTGTNAGKVKVGNTYYSASISGSTVTVNLGAATLSDGSNVVAIDAQAFKDGAGNYCAAYDGSTDTPNWSFTVDTTPPTVVAASRTPSNGTTITDGTSTIELSFDFSETLTSKTDGVITIKKKSGTGGNVTINDAVASGVTVSAEIDPADLSDETTYSIEFAAGAFEDAAGNDCAAYTGSWSITFDKP